MNELSLPMVCFMALGFGLLHALDGDHLIAVTGLSSGSSAPGQRVGYCTRWALGHGLTLSLVGIPVLFMGAAIPVTLSDMAERLVGVLLVVIGLRLGWVLFLGHFDGASHQGIGKRPSPLPAGQGDGPGGSNHAHHSYWPVGVGMAHGLGGSAPLLSLLPLFDLTPWHGLLYLVLFSCGALIAMLAFGGLLKAVFISFSAMGQGLVFNVRLGVVGLALGYGVFLMV
ncbi:MAG: hypothetical protein HQL52_05895 [Magnetococcales bacterium]|nr:hypothetical protein [Magnetococcales bacterium]